MRPAAEPGSWGERAVPAFLASSGLEAVRCDGEKPLVRGLDNRLHIPVLPLTSRVTAHKSPNMLSFLFCYRGLGPSAYTQQTFAKE